MIYAVIDTNVFVSALLSEKEDAATVQLVRKILLGNIIPVYSEKILSEYREVLQRPKFNFPAEDQRYLLAAIEKYGEYVVPQISGSSLPDEKDLPFYEAANMNEAWYLVTGNMKHFPEESFIVTPREMLIVLKKMQSSARK